MNVRAPHHQVEESLQQAVGRQILMARTRIYRLFQPTPLEELESSLPLNVFLKREDRSPIHSYKWRGAFNAMAQLSEAERACGVVAASAGNHAQGIAASARQLNIPARLYMPACAPLTKQRAVETLGGPLVQICIHGATYDESAAAARRDAEESGRRLVHAYDDLAVVGGQGTIADEILTQAQGTEFDVAFLQIGGGGMAAANALWLKSAWPKLRVIGVEAEGQASMAAALTNGKPVDLDAVDTFCDGTCVRRAGRIGFELLRDLLDDIVVVSREEICRAIGFLWDARRILPEPAGALGFAGLLREQRNWPGANALTVISGGNLDLASVASIAQQASSTTVPVREACDADEDSWPRAAAG